MENGGSRFVTVILLPLVSNGQSSQRSTEIEKLVRSPERADLDFETEVGDSDQAARLIAAMANSGGGKILFGATEGTPVGLESPTETRRLLKAGAKAVDPVVPLDLEEVQVDGLPIVMATVGSGDRQLYVPPDGAILKRESEGRAIPVSEQDLISGFAQDAGAPTHSERQLAKQLAKTNEEIATMREELRAALTKGFEETKKHSGWKRQWPGWIVSAALGAVISLVLTLVFVA